MPELYPVQVSVNGSSHQGKGKLFLLTWENFSHAVPMGTFGSALPQSAAWIWAPQTCSTLPGNEARKCGSGTSAGMWHYLSLIAHLGEHLLPIPTLEHLYLASSSPSSHSPQTPQLAEVSQCQIVPSWDSRWHREASTCPCTGLAPTQ